MQVPRAEAHRAQAKNAEDGAPFPSPLMSPRNTRMNQKIIQEDDETQPRGCRMTATRHYLARLLKYYPRQPSAPGLIKSRFFSPTTNLLTVLTFLHFEIPYMYTRGES